jgi:hypothetical protein
VNDVVIPAPPPNTAGPVRPRTRSRVAIAAVVAAMLVLGGAGVFLATQGGGEAQAGPLALAFEEGDTHRYRIEQTMDLTLGGRAFDAADLGGVDRSFVIEIGQLVEWSVRDVDDDGVATIRVTTEDLSMTVDGMPFPSTGGTPAVDIRLAADGRVLSIGGPSLGGGTIDLGGLTGLFDAPTEQMTPLLPPDADARPGDTWDVSYSQEMPFGEGSVEVEATSRYDRDGSVDGTDAAVIVTDSQVSMDLAFAFADVLAILGEAGPPSGATGAVELRDASIASTGAGTTTSTSWLDLDGKDVLRTESSGDLDLTLEVDGVSEAQGTLTISGTFSMEMSREA